MAEQWRFSRSGQPGTSLDAPPLDKLALVSRCRHKARRLRALLVEARHFASAIDKESNMAKKSTKTRPTKRPRPPEQRQTKQNAVLALLRRPQGASIAEIITITDWRE